MRRLELKPLARADLKAIRAQSRRMFGPGAQQKYGALMKRAFDLLRVDPRRPGAQRREDLPGDALSFHLRHARARGMSPKRPRHVIIFGYDDATLTVFRVLYDTMDFAQHLGEAGE